LQLVLMYNSCSSEIFYESSVETEA
jgi:hypothetical protein